MSHVTKLSVHIFLCELKQNFITIHGFQIKVKEISHEKNNDQIRIDLHF